MVGKLAFLSRLFYPRPPLFGEQRGRTPSELAQNPSECSHLRCRRYPRSRRSTSTAVARIDANEERQPIKQKIEVFLGDYIDRGPDARKVLETLTERAKTHELVCLKGNHEALMLRFLDDATVLRVCLGWP